MTFCSVQSETPLLFIETARDILSLDPADSNLLTWDRGFKFGYRFYLSVCQGRFFLKKEFNSKGEAFNAPGSRFQYDGSSTVLIYAQFRSNLLSVVGSCLEFWQFYSVKPTHRTIRIKAFCDLRNYLQTNLCGVGYLKMQHLLMVAAPIGLVPLWVAGMAVIEYNGRTFTRLWAAYGFDKSDVTSKCADGFLTTSAAAIGQSLSVTENAI